MFAADLRAKHFLLHSTQCLFMEPYCISHSSAGERPPTIQVEELMLEVLQPKNERGTLTPVANTEDWRSLITKPSGRESTWLELEPIPKSHEQEPSTAKLLRDQVCGGR